MKKILLAIWEIVEVIVISLAIILIVRYLLFQPFFVEGLSMSPNFDNGDYLIVDELTYRLREPNRGEVIVFRSPQDKNNYFIKRIIGLPEESIIIRDGDVIIFNNDNPDGLMLSEDYIITKTPGNISVDLKENQYFVLGDNRQASFDSRNWGFLSEDNIIGLARLRLWPISSAEAFSVPSY